MGDGGTNVVVSKFEGMQQLETLSLEANDITNDGAMQLAIDLPHLKKLLAFGLSGNKIGAVAKENLRKYIELVRLA